MLCVVFTKAVFTTYHEEQVLSSDGNIYLLQYGSYISKDVMEENIKELSNYVIDEEEGKYYVYLGAYTNLENAYIVRDMFKNEGIYLYVKNSYIGNSEVIKKISTIEKKISELEGFSTKIFDINKEIVNVLKSIVS